MLFPFLSLFALGSFSSAGVLYVNVPSPSRIPEFASSDLTMEPPFASAYFPTSISRSLAQSNSPLGFAASRSDE